MNEGTYELQFQDSSGQTIGVGSVAITIMKNNSRETVITTLEGRTASRLAWLMSKQVNPGRVPLKLRFISN